MQRVLVSTVVGIVLMVQLDRFGVVGGAIVQLGDLPAFGVLPEAVRSAEDAPLRLGATGLVLGGVAGSWFEFRRLKAAVRRRLDVSVSAGGSRRGRLVLPAAAALLVGWIMRGVVDDWVRLLGGPVAALAVGGTYVLVALRTHVDEARVLLGTLTRRVRRG